MILLAAWAALMLATGVWCRWWYRQPVDTDVQTWLVRTLRRTVVVLALDLAVITPALFYASFHATQASTDSLRTQRHNQFTECQKRNTGVRAHAATVKVLLDQQERGLRDLKRILPSLNTPEIRALARRNLDEQIAAYRAELLADPLVDCTIYGP